MPSMDSLLGLAVGLALSTAAGLRVFVPPAHSLAVRSGRSTLTPGMAWIAFATASVLEVGGQPSCSPRYHCLEAFATGGG